MSPKSFLRWALAPALLLAAALPAFALELGEEAPEIDVTEWLQGEALQAGPGEKILVVHFFATFDGDCKAAIPELTKILEEHAAGLEMLGISSEHSATVKEYLAENEVKWRVAVDGNDNTKAIYCKGIFKLPHAVVIGKDGKVAWMGDPTAGMADVVGKLIAGTYDLAKVIKTNEVRAELVSVLQKRPPDEDRMAAAAEKLLDLEPGDTLALNVRYSLFERQDDVDGYGKFVRKLMATAEKAEDHGALNNLSWRLVTHGSLKWRDADVALQAARKAVELSEGKDSGIVDTLARVLFELGLIEDAVKEQKKAIELAEDEDEKKSLGVSLAYYEACLATRSKAGGTKKKPRR